ncbi:MAG: hypothetical protein CSA62_06980 [Planctomycetota bacterium]|nr:MAG: hypothetical protein CSA62_06980 [Planctomycetota bacterium]
MFEIALRLCRNEETLAGELRIPDANGPRPALLFVPDILLSRRHGFYPWFCERLAQERLVLSLDAGHGGYGETEGRAQGCLPSFDKQRASEYLLSRELQDLVHVVRSLARGDLDERAQWDGKHLTLAGHGKGAAIALHLYRRLMVEGYPVSSVLLLSPPATLVREGILGDRLRIHVPADPGTDQGDTDVVLGSEFFSDARELAEMATLSELMSSCEAPTLLLCGEEDPVFGINEAERLLRVGHTEKDSLLVVEMAGHHFGAAHPFEGPTAPLLYAAEQCEHFLSNCEREQSDGPGDASDAHAIG